MSSNDVSPTEIPIKKLANYCLDYAKLTTGFNLRSGKKIETNFIPEKLLSSNDLLFKENSDDVIKFKLRVRKLDIPAD